MEEDLRQLIELAIRRQGGNPLWPNGFEPFREIRCRPGSLLYLYAKVVAEEFAHGEMSYADGDVAMNQLSTIMDIDLRGFPLDIYQAFDAGEFYRDDDPKDTIPWQKYTLPAVMEALAREGLQPRA